MTTITIEQLISSPGRLIDEAEGGQISVVTKDGRPLFLTVPFDERLASEQVHVALAIRLYEQEVIGLGKAARLAGVPISDFIDRLGALNIPVIRYSAEDLRREVAAFG